MSREDIRIFLSYTKADVERADEIYDWLTQKGSVIWKDDKSIVPGQNWDHEIKKALDKAQLVLVLISNNSVSKRGYVQREIKAALDKLLEKLIDDIYIIPILLDDDAIVPDILSSIHYVKYSDPRFREKVVDSINAQLERLGQERRESGEPQDIQWSTSTLREEWDGIPGYEFECEFLKFTSSRFPNVGQIGEYIRGEFLKELFLIRRHKLDQSIEFHNYTQDKWARTNTFGASVQEISLVGKVITIPYNIYGYSAGAAHPNHGHQNILFHT